MERLGPGEEKLSPRKPLLLLPQRLWLLGLQVSGCPHPRFAGQSEGMACVVLTFSISETLVTLLGKRRPLGSSSESPLTDASPCEHCHICALVLLNQRFSKCGLGTPGVPQETFGGSTMFIRVLRCYLSFLPSWWRFPEAVSGVLLQWSDHRGNDENLPVFYSPRF